MYFLVFDVLVEDGLSVLVLDDHALLSLGELRAEQARLEVDCQHFPIRAARQQDVPVEAPTQICDTHHEGIHEDSEWFGEIRLPDSDCGLGGG